MNEARGPNHRHYNGHVRGRMKHTKKVAAAVAAARNGVCRVLSIENAAWGVAELTQLATELERGTCDLEKLNFSCATPQHVSPAMFARFRALRPSGACPNLDVNFTWRTSDIAEAEHAARTVNKQRFLAALHTAHRRAAPA